MSQLHDVFARARLFVDATPLLETNWAGISNVCANIGRCLIEEKLQVDFCVNRTVLDRASVIEALDRSSGLVLARELAVGRSTSLISSVVTSDLTIGISSSVKRFHRLFDVECSWIHDISTLLQPEYHTPENIVWHMERITEDLESNDLTACISQATLDDLKVYLGVPEDKLILAPNSVSWPWWFWVKERNEPRREPYLLVLGTLEPRKNLAIVFEMLADCPEILCHHKILIVGQQGWMQDQVSLPPALDRAIAADRIVYTGYLTDYQKFVLLRGADATIFPSLFEGFGLPVIESLSVGTPCVASFSSSIPEVGGRYCSYFDPFSSAGLRIALDEVVARNLKSDHLFWQSAMEWVSGFSWKNSVVAVLQGLTPSLLRAAGGNQEVD